MRIFSVLSALLVTFLWSTSFILIKMGLDEIPALTFAGLRYSLGFLCFIPFMLHSKRWNEVKKLSASQWSKLVGLGIVFYTLTQGAQFLGLSMLPSVTVSLMLNFTPIVVAVMGIFWLQEKPGKLQWSGCFLFLVGIFVYFTPLNFSGNQGLGLVVMLFGVVANAGSAILGRDLNRNRDISPLTITFVSMGIGALILLAVGLGKDGFPEIEFRNGLLLLWLSGVNTAFAFWLWNWTLQRLTAIESSIINGTMLIQIAVLAYVFLGESITIQEGFGMVFAGLGAVLVQLKFSSKRSL